MEAVDLGSVERGMAVQAQHPFNHFPPDFCGSKYPRSGNGVLEESPMLNGRDLYIARLLGSNAVPASELNRHDSASKKRIRDHPSSPMALPQPHQLQCPVPLDISAGLQSRPYGTAEASTSGRPAPSPVVSASLTHELMSMVYHQNLEIDGLILLQTEQLRLGLEVARKRFSVLEQQAVKRLKQKEMELENARQMNAQLEEKVRQVAAESQFWFDVANNNEAIVSGLRTTLDQVEGYGDSDVPDDAQSWSFGEEERKITHPAVALLRENEGLRFQRACRVCGEGEVCVLLLPCRHLCLCKDCEPMLETCPVCHSTMNARLEISMS